MAIWSYGDENTCIKVSTLLDELDQIKDIIINQPPTPASELVKEARKYLDSLDRTESIAKHRVWICRLADALSQSESRAARYREALDRLVGATKNELASRGLPLEWSQKSAMAQAVAALSESP